MAWNQQDTSYYLLDQIELAIATRNYINKTYEFMEEWEIENPALVISCIVMTTAWVYANMGHYLTKGIIPDILNIREAESNPDDIIKISKKYVRLSHEQLLTAIIGAFNET